MRSARLWPLLALIPWLAGCPAPILSEQPLGDEIAVLNPEKVNGMWLGPDGALFGIRVVDAEKGRFAYWETSADRANPPLLCQPPSNLRDTCSNDDGSASNGTCTLRRQQVPGAQWPFFFVEWRDKKRLYATDAIATSNGDSFAVIYPISASVFSDRGPVYERLEELVTNHALPGRIDAKGTVVLGPLSPEHYELILAQESGLFNWTAGFPLIKLPDELDTCKKGQQLNPDAATKPNGKVDTSPDLRREPAGQEQPAR